MSEATTRRVLARGVWEENPVLIQLLGLCPALAVTNTVENSLAMGLATTFVLVASSTLVSLVKDVIPDQVRISAYILIIATFVTVVDLAMAAIAPGVSKALGAFVPLIVVNCMILGRQEAFASRNPTGRAALDALGTSAGFILALLLLGGVRELLGAGTLLGARVLPGSWEPWIIMILPPGGFFTLGVVLMALGWWWGRKEEERGRARPRRWPHGVSDRLEAGIRPASRSASGAARTAGGPAGGATGEVGRAQAGQAQAGQAQAGRTRTGRRGARGRGAAGGRP